MACSIIKEKRINTTLAKAKALRMYLEPILTKSKKDTTHNRRIVFSYLQNKHTINELFRKIAPKISDRNGGYLRIIKIGFRKGDGAEIALIELVDFNNLYNIKNNNNIQTIKRARRKSQKDKKLIIKNETDEILIN